MPENIISAIPEEKETIQLLSAEVQEIITYRPGWIVRNGSLLFLLIIASLFACTFFIRYPDLVITKATITSINAPKSVITKTSGKLIKLFVKEGEQTVSGNVLGYMESTASHEEVIKLSDDIDTLQNLINSNEIVQALHYLNTVYTDLGEIQQGYQAFRQSFSTFSNYIAGGFYLSKKKMLSKDLVFLQKMHNNIMQQKELNVQDLALTQKTFDANQSLKDDKVISDLDYRNEKSKLINKKLSVPQINSAIISNESQQNEKRKEIMELENTIAQQKSIFSQSLNTLKSQTDDWKKKYLLTAPTDGKIAFATFLQENQQLQLNQIICFTNPENSEYYAEVYIPQTNFGKVRTGQEVLLKFPSYPFQEYGSIKGKIDFISNISTDSGYLAKVILPNGLNTSYKKQLQFREGLKAQGEIITADMSLLQRFYYNIIKQVNSHQQ